MKKPPLDEANMTLSEEQYIEIKEQGIIISSSKTVLSNSVAAKDNC
jgi:hypothetical protein